MLFFYILVCIFGLIFGSFLTSFTYRILQGELLPKGRSYCPNCKKTIAWYDNIPLFSYFFLQGKCRNCHKKISVRYPLIELTTAFLFLGIFHGFTVCQTVFVTNPLCMLTTSFGFGSLLFLYGVSFIFFSIFIIDYEYQIIPDVLSLFLLIVSFLYILLTGTDAFWVHVLCGFLASLFLLILHIGTKGRGMGLGDVKLALSFGILLGYPFTITWLFVSFLLGSIVGIILLSFRKVQFGMHIPFGPFLIAAYFMVLFWGDMITKFVIPYL